jgi:hypothetical protein
VPASDRENQAFDAAAAVVTCLIAGDLNEARRITYSNDTLHQEMILVLAGALAAGHTAESWQTAVLAAYSQEG